MSRRCRATSRGWRWQGARHWPGDLRLSLNVTPVDLALPRAMPTNCWRWSQAAAFRAGRLTLEVTEQALLADIQLAAAHAGGG